MRKDRWNTYSLSGFSYDVANDQASAGGVHIRQIKRGCEGWMHRVLQINGNHRASGPAEPIDAAHGEACYECAKTY